MKPRSESPESSRQATSSTSGSVEQPPSSSPAKSGKRRKPLAAASKKRKASSNRRKQRQPRRPRGSERRKQAQNEGFRSAFEHDTAKDLDRRGVEWEYEKEAIPWQPKEKQYLPDFFLPNGIIVECKGKFDADDRAKHLALREQHPDKDIRLLFQNANNKLRKGAKMTYGEWCDKHGIVWANKTVPREWLK